MGMQLSDLGERLTKLRERTSPETAGGEPQRATSDAAVRFAFRSGIGVLTTVVLGSGLGWLLDSWLGTLPLFLILFFFVGAGAGLFNIFWAARALQR